MDTKPRYRVGADGSNLREVSQSKTVGPIPQNRGWWPIAGEAFAGAWQRNVEVRLDTALSFHASFTCQTLIASDIAKLPLRLVGLDSDGVWSETKNSAYSPVLRKPNHFQNRIQFIESWVLSKLQRGNTYVLKQRDGRRVVEKLYVLNPDLVTPMVADSGDIFYELRADNLTGISARVLVPASEIIHDRFNCFFHPLVGLSPVFAGGLAAMQGLAIQNNSTLLFQNGAMPGGILTAAGEIDDADALRLKEYWETEFTGKQRGKVAVLGSGLKYEALAIKAVDNQLIEQLKWSAEVVCSTYHVPPYKAGVGQVPAHNNVQALNVEYYSQCLQRLIEDIELCLDEGLATGEQLGTEFDVDNLLRMDSVTQMEVLDKGKNVMTLDERRKRLSLGKITGGATVYLQQQDHSIEAIAARDAQLIQQASEPAAPVEPPANDNAEQEAIAEAAKLLGAFEKGLAHV